VPQILYCLIAIDKRYGCERRKYEQSGKTSESGVCDAKDMRSKDGKDDESDMANIEVMQSLFIAQEGEIGIC